MGNRLGLQIGCDHYVGNDGDPADNLDVITAHCECQLLTYQILGVELL